MPPLDLIGDLSQLGGFMVLCGPVEWAIHMCKATGYPSSMEATLALFAAMWPS